MTLCEGLWIGVTDPGIALVYGIIMSFVLDWIPAFEYAAARVKRLVVMALALAIPLVASLLLVAFDCAALDRELIWQALYAGMAWFLGSQFAHLRDLPTK
jgi:hypothetical protein